VDRSGTNYEAKLILVEEDNPIKDGSCRGVISAFYKLNPIFLFENIGFFNA
jgi:hypothetical protein